MPDIFFDTLELIPEGLREKAVKKEDGKFKVGVVHESFRDNNIELKKASDLQAAALGVYKEKIGDDPTKFFNEMTELRAVKQKVDDGTLKGSEAVTAEVEKRTKAAQEGFQGQLQTQAGMTAAEKTRADSYEAKWKDQIVIQGITNAVLDPANGANTAALVDFVERAKRDFRVNKDGNLVRMEGDTMVYGASGEGSETPKEWLAKVLKAAPYLSKASAGSGADDKDVKGFKGKSAEELTRMTPAERLREARKQMAAR